MDNIINGPHVLRDVDMLRTLGQTAAAGCTVGSALRPFQVILIMGQEGFLLCCRGPLGMVHVDSGRFAITVVDMKDSGDVDTVGAGFMSRITSFTNFFLLKL